MRLLTFDEWSGERGETTLEKRIWQGLVYGQDYNQGALERIETRISEHVAFTTRLVEMMIKKDMITVDELNEILPYGGSTITGVKKS